MNDPENNKQGKGFNGLRSLGSKSADSSAKPTAIPERKVESPELPAAWVESTDRPAPSQQSQSQTAASPMRGWLIWLLAIGAAVALFIWFGSQLPSNQSYSSPSATDSSPNTTGYQRPSVVEAKPAAPPPGPTVTLPPVGNGLVLTSPQIRYCVYEDRRIKGAERVVDNYDQASVNTFNAMVDDYNRRCSHFRYRSGSLAPIQREADRVREQLEQEGRDRMTSFQGRDDAAAAIDAAAVSASTSDSTASDATIYKEMTPSSDAHADDAGFEGDTTVLDGAERAPRDAPHAAFGTYVTSFDCSKARSIPEHLICHDPLLSEDDRELAQLYQKAKASVTDSAELVRRMREQWNYRENNCRDKRCLSDWYVSQKGVLRRVAQTGDAYAQ